MTDAIPDEIMREARNLYNTLWGVGAVVSENEQNKNVAIIARALMARPRMPFDEMAAEVMLDMYREHMYALRDGKEEWRKEIFAALETLEKAFPKAKVLIDERYPVEADNAK